MICNVTSPRLIRSRSASKPDLELGPGGCPVADPGAGLAGQLQMAAEEVRVEVGVDDADDPQALRVRVLEVLLDVAAGVDDDRSSAVFVTDR
jgi:hypothetical protein